MSESINNDINLNETDLEKSTVENFDISSEKLSNDQSVDAMVCDSERENFCKSQETSPCERDESIKNERSLKDELEKIKLDYEDCRQRENDLNEELRKVDFQTVKVAELEILNEELREQLNESLKECCTLREDLTKTKQEKNDLINQASTPLDGKEDKSCFLQDQIKSLEEQNVEYEKELNETKDKLHSHDLAAKKAISTLKKELTLRIDQVTKMYEDCLRERDGLNMKVSQLTEEKQEIVKMQDTMNTKISNMEKENERLQQQIKKINNDYKSSQATLLAQEREIIAKQKEVEKSQEDVSSHTVKMKWSQNKLKAELDSHKETKVKLAQTLQKLKEAKEEGEQIRADCQAMIKQYQESEEMRSNSLDQELKQKESELQKHTQSIANHDENNKNLLQELNRKKAECKNLSDENNQLNTKIKVLDDKVAKYALAISTYEKTVANQRKEIDNQISKIEELEKMRSRLYNSEECNQELKSEKEKLTTTFNELKSEMDLVYAKESDLLGYIEKLTATCTKLQSTISDTESQNEELKKENEELKANVDDLKAENNSLNMSLKSEMEAKVMLESDLLHKLEEKTKTVQELATNLEDVRNELKVAKKKNSAHIKDITRQLQQSKRKIDLLEKNSNKERIDSGSRTSSSSSLDKVDGPAQQSINGSNNYQTNPAILEMNNGRVPQCPSEDLMSTVVEVKTKSPSSSKVNNSDLDHEKSIMLERICQLQKRHAKNSEKIDFLEEHNQTLVEEITKQKRLIQYYLLKEDSGHFTSSDYDEKKAKLAKNRGVMSSVYSSKPTDSTMTLELSLQISTKLQALLEDTILKNITLKESIETLGDEVARLSTALCEKQSENST